MSGKFDNIPVEEDTRILLSLPMKFGPFDIVYQMWSWEGITAESIIFMSEDVAEMSDDELEQMVKNRPTTIDDSGVTLSRGKEYTFVNFNFVTD